MDRRRCSKSPCGRLWRHKCVNSSNNSFRRLICWLSVVPELCLDCLAEMVVDWEDLSLAAMEADTEAMEEAEISHRNWKVCSVWKNFSADSAFCRRLQPVNRLATTLLHGLLWKGRWPVWEEVVATQQGTSDRRLIDPSLLIILEAMARAYHPQ